ncbi:MAG TPA: type II toxin-antitoxin system VapC family toxin [Chthoniobacteraceae bacterium]|jgi:predicted nucleic-acid-binding protein|nr:type II toxin-antitoxin system VapC family toxin [Chthoniobacteraceae bacterium]
MTGLDTNNLVRYLEQDDEEQLVKVLRMMNKKGAVFFVPDLALAELDWVLTSIYDWTRSEVAEAIGRLLTIHNLVFEDEGRLKWALRLMRDGAELADALIIARCREWGCRDVASFDKGMVKHHAGFAFTPT